MKAKLGGSQGKIYIRPIQKVLLINPITQQRVSQRMEKSIMCVTEIPVKDLCEHFSSCSLEISADDSEHGDLPPVFNNKDAVSGIFNFL